MAKKTTAQILDTSISEIFRNFADTQTNTPQSKTELENILSRLTPAGRAAAVYSLRDQPLPQAVIDEAVSFLLSDDQPYTAAKIVKRSNDVERVLKIYSDAGMFNYAAKFAKDNGEIDISRKFAGLFIDQLAKEKESYRLFDYALDLMGIDKAMELFLTHHQQYGSRKVLDYLARDKRWDDAITLCEKVGWFSDAGHYARQAGRDQEAISFYKKVLDESKRNGHLGLAVDYALSAGELEEAKTLVKPLIDKAVKEGKFDYARSLAMEVGMNKQAKQFQRAHLEKMLSEKGMHYDSMRSFEEEAFAEGMGDIVVRVKHKKGDYSGAIWAAEKAEMVSEALAMCERYHEYVSGATIAAKHQVPKRAEAFALKAFPILEKKGKFQDAYNLAQKIGLQKQAMVYGALVKMIQK